MAIISRTGTQKLAKPIGEVKLTACVYNTALTFPSIKAGAPPVTDASTGVAVIDCLTYGGGIVTFSGSDTAAQTFVYAIYGYFPMANTNQAAYWPMKVAAGTVTLGAKTLGADGAFIEATGSLIADTITETTACTLSEVYSPGSGEAAAILVDVSAFQYLAIHVTRDSGTAVRMNVHINLCDGFAPKNLIEASVTMGSVDLSGTAASNLGSIKTNTDPLVTAGVGGYVRQDSTGTIAKESGGNLAAVATALVQLTTTPTDKAAVGLTPVVIGTPGTPVPLIGSQTWASKMVLQAGRAGSSNASPVSVGPLNVSYASNLQIQLATGDTFIHEVGPGEKFDVAAWYLDGVDTLDGVRGYYVPA